jgi:phage shock protein C
MQKLYRSTQDKKIAGICGGVSELMNVDPTIVRLLFVLFALLTAIFPFIVVYLLGWWLIPEGTSN